MSKIKNDLVDWQKAIQELSNYEPTDKYVAAIHRIKQLEQELAEAKAAIASQAQQPTQEPVAWMNPYGGLLHVRETGLEKATFTIPLYLQSQAQQPTDLSEQLREYADNSGYSHNDYADTMLAAASEIERLTASQAQQPTSEQVEQAVSLLKSLRGLCDVEDYPTIDGIISTLAAQAQQEIEIDMLTGDVTWKFNEAQTQEPLEIQALTTICKLLDGSQPKDPLGALFVAQSALRQSQAQQSQWISVEDELPAYGQIVDLSINGVLQKETYEIDATDNDLYLTHFWTRDGLDDGLAIKQGQFWRARLPMPKPLPPEGDKE